jgi:hypothetical protein
VNKDLYGKEYEIPRHLLNILSKSLQKYGDKSSENVKRVEDLIKTGKATYQQLKRIKNWFDSNGNTSDPEFHLLGGGSFKGWVDQTLNGDRGSIDLAKKAKSVVMNNQYLDSHEKNTDVGKDLSPGTSHKSNIHRHATGLEEQVNRINQLIKNIL